MRSYIIIILCLTLNLVHSQKLIPEVVVSGNKMSTEKKKITQTIEVINAETIEKQSPSSSGEMLMNTGKITVQQSQNGGGSPIIRGFEANRVLIVVDGVRMNTAIFRSGHLQNVMRIDPSQLHDLEVYYGAGSTLYGSDAMGGVLYFETARPKLRSIAGKTISGNAFGRFTTASAEKTGGFTFNIGTNKFASLTAFTYTDFGDLMMGNYRDQSMGEWGKRVYTQAFENNIDIMKLNPNPNLQTGTAYSQYNILQKFLYQPNYLTKHSLNFQYSNSSDINRYDRLTEKRNNSLIEANPISNPFTSAEWYYGPEARMMIAYDYDQDSFSSFAQKLKITAAYQNYKESRHTRNFGNRNKRNQMENVDVATLNIDLFKKIENHSFSYGLEAVQNWVSSSARRFNILTGATSYATTRYPDGGSTTTNLSAYIQDIVTLVPNFSYLNLGARISHNSVNATVNDTTRKYNSFEINNIAYSFNTGLKLIPTKSNMISLNISSAYRTPNLDDVTKIFENETHIQVNSPDLSPEKSINFEINSENKIEDIAKIDFGVYYTSIYDYISNVRTTVNGNSSEIINGKVYEYRKLGNENSAYIAGFFGGVGIQFLSNLKFSSSFNYTYGRLKQSSGQEIPLDHIPPISGTLALEWKLGKLQIEPFALWNGPKRSEDYNLEGEDNQNKSLDPVRGFTPAWYTLNVRSKIDFSANLSLQASLENIADAHYRVFASGISAPGRNLRLTARVKF